ncbi:MAG: hypothetical protein KDI16_14855 [Halioglobus sp.]|nr:hypothetical protein [Halioglobus sp.]
MSLGKTSRPEADYGAQHHAGGDASTTDQVAQAAHAAIDKAAANLAHAERALREAQAAAGVKVSEVSTQARQLGGDSLASVRQYVHEHPARSVGIAFAAGYLLSVLLKK